MTNAAQVALARIKAWTRMRARRQPLSPMPTHKVTYPWGVKSKNYAAGRHTGEDYSTKGLQGIPVYAVSEARVVESSDFGGTWGTPYGRMVVLEMRNRLGTHRYGTDVDPNRVKVRPPKLSAARRRKP